MAQARKRRDEERRLEEEEEARIAAEAAALVPKTFHDVLEARAPVLAFLSLACSLESFKASTETRSLLSALVTVHLSYSVCGVTEVPGSKAYEESRRCCLKVRERLPQGSAGGPVRMFLRLQAREQPLRRALINRALSRVMPTIRWEDLKRIKYITYENLETLDRGIQRDVVAIGGADVPMLVNDRDYLRSIQRITLTMSQFQNLELDANAIGEEFIMPNVVRVKISVQDASFSDDEFTRLYAAFPALRRLHLVTFPAGLLPLCGPGIMAPEDLRLSLAENSNPAERQANFFVASHLFSLPFSWSGDFFKRVIRLQCSELNEDLQGLSLEKLLDCMKGGGMPLLRRLGTVSSRAACHFDISRDDCKLEELVVVIELDDVKDFFASFVDLERQKTRGELRRLAVHIICSDGAARVKPDVEKAICAGWHNIACFLMRADGWVGFSFGSKALQETAIGQLPWFLPQHFCLDTVNYGDGRLPISTPLDRPLPFYGIDGLYDGMRPCIPQPSGTLVCGNLRAAAQEACREAGMASPASLADMLAAESFGNGLSFPTPSSPGSSGRLSGGAARKQSVSAAAGAGASRGRRSTLKQEVVSYTQDWMSLYLVDAIEALMNAAEAQRAEFMQARPGQH